MSTRPMRTVAMVVGGGSVFGLAVVLVSMVVVVIFALLLWNNQPAAVPTPAPVAERPVPVEVPVAVAPTRSDITLASTPSGADVLRDGAVIGTTPLTIRLAEGEVWNVEIQADGYRSREVRLGDGVLSPSVTLEALPRRTPAPTQPKAKPVPEPEPAPVPVPVPEPEPTPVPPPRPRGGGADIIDPFEDD